MDALIGTKLVLAFKLQGYSLSTVKIGEKLAEDGVRSRVTVYNRSSVCFVYTVRYSFPMAVLKRICLKVKSTSSQRSFSSFSRP